MEETTFLRVWADPRTFCRYVARCVARVQCITRGVLECTTPCVARVFVREVLPCRWPGQLDLCKPTCTKAFEETDSVFSLQGYRHSFAVVLLQRQCVHRSLPQEVSSVHVHFSLVFSRLRLRRGSPPPQSPQRLENLLRSTHAGDLAVVVTRLLTSPFALATRVVSRAHSSSSLRTSCIVGPRSLGISGWSCFTSPEQQVLCHVEGLSQRSASNFCKPSLALEAGKSECWLRTFIWSRKLLLLVSSNDEGVDTPRCEAKGLGGQRLSNGQAGRLSPSTFDFSSSVWQLGQIGSAVLNVYLCHLSLSTLLLVCRS